MSGKIISYPELTDELFISSGFSCGIPSFSYNEDEEVYSLNVSDIDDTPGNQKFLLKDDRCHWDPNTYNLNIHFSVSFTQAYCFFGESGIAEEDTVLGVGIQWSSRESNQRGIKEIGIIRSNDSVLSFDGNMEYLHGDLKGKLKFSVCIYVKKCNYNRIYSNFASIGGTILGTLINYEFIIDGNGSLFPIVYFNDSTKPLFEVYVNEYASLITDKFDNENVEIRINQAHPGYRLISEENITQSPVFIEIMSSAMFIIIESVKEIAGEEWNNLISYDEGEEGSIASAFYYFVNKLEWDVSSPLNLSCSIHSFFDRMRGDI